MSKKILMYDSTLRDGAQALGISFTVEDKLKIVEKLDKLGIDYVEAGNPGSNPKDLEFFERVSRMNLTTSKLIAFGATRRANINVADDSNVQSLLAAGTGAIAVFGKSWNFHVFDILKTTLEENLRMIYDTIKYFKEHGKEVVFDAEHFFDGYEADPEYAMATLKTACEAGADSICLCDTRGASLPSQIARVTTSVLQQIKCDIGIHCHNDNGMAVASSISAVEVGAVQVQGTINGFGERCGNANLCTIIPNLQLRMDYECIPAENMKKLSSTARFVSEVANIIHDERAPFVGKCAFAHKAGMHADAVNKNTSAYEIMDPDIVGNQRNILMSEVAGRSAVLSLINTVDSSIKKDSPQTQMIIDKLKEMEYEGYKYEGAETSFELVIRKMLGMHKPFFELKEFKVIVNEPTMNSVNSAAMIKIMVGDQTEITAAEGDGPVNALDKALRKALERFYSKIAEMKLTDYKVRVLDSNSATASKVRVVIESTDGKDVWTTVGVSTDIIEASWRALVDSVEHKLIKDMEE